jgi:hypothetical protein
VPCGVGDWAVTLRSPEGTVVARVCPFDLAYRAFVDLCRKCAGNRWLPRIELAADLEGGGSVVFLEFEAALRVSCRAGDRSGLAYASLGLACLAADRGDWQQAAALHGAAQAFIDQIAEPWQEPEARYRRDSLHKVRTSFGEEQSGRAYAKGMTLSLDQALGLALAKARPA